MTKIIVNNNELIDKFHEQLRSIEIFSKIYDEGDRHIVQDMSVKFRVLFHNNPATNCHSLLHQLKLEHLPFVSTAMKYDPKFMQSHLALVGIKFTDSDMIAEFSASLDNAD